MAIVSIKLKDGSIADVDLSKVTQEDIDFLAQNSAQPVISVPLYNNAGVADVDLTKMSKDDALWLNDNAAIGNQANNAPRQPTKPKANPVEAKFHEMAQKPWYSWEGVKGRGYALTHPKGGLGNRAKAALWDIPANFAEWMQGINKLGLSDPDVAPQLLMGVGMPNTGFINPNQRPMTPDERLALRAKVAVGIKKEFQDPVEKKIADLGGRDIYTGVSRLIQDLLPISKTEAAVGSVLPFLESGVKKVLAKEIAEAVVAGEAKKIPLILARHVPEAALKGAVKTGVTGTLYTTAKTGSGEEGLKAFPQWAAVGALMSPLHVAGEARATPAGDVWLQSLRHKEIGRVVQDIRAAFPDTVTPEQIAATMQSWLPEAKATGDINGYFQNKIFQSGDQAQAEPVPPPPQREMLQLPAPTRFVAGENGAPLDLQNPQSPFIEKPLLQLPAPSARLAMDEYGRVIDIENPPAGPPQPKQMLQLPAPTRFVAGEQGAPMDLQNPPAPPPAIMPKAELPQVPPFNPILNIDNAGRIVQEKPVVPDVQAPQKPPLELAPPTRFVAGEHGTTDLTPEYGPPREGRLPTQDEMANAENQQWADFQKENPNTNLNKLFQGDKGNVDFTKDGKVIVTAFQNADVTTLIHEIGHIMRRDMNPEALSKIEAQYKVKKGVWTKEAEEAFAKDFEKYISEGKTPNPKLQYGFSKMSDWMKEAYKGVEDSPLARTVSPEMKTLFSKLTSPKYDIGDVVVRSWSSQKQDNKTTLQDVKTNAGNKLSALNPANDIMGKLNRVWFNHISNIDFLKKINPELYKEAKLLKGGSGKAYRFLRDNLVPAFEATKGKVVTVNGKERGAPELATDLAYARHAESLIKRDIQMPDGTPEKIKAIYDTVDAVKAKHPELGSAIEETATQLHNAAQSILQYYVNKGVMSVKQAEAMERVNPFYIPMNRVIEEADNAAAGKPVGASNAFKRIKGSKKAVIDPAESIASNIISMIPRADRHVFLRNVVDEFMASPELVELLTKKTMIKRPLQKTEMVKILKDAGIDEAGLPVDELQRIVHVFSPKVEMGKNDIGFMRNGEWEFYTVENDMLAQVLKDAYRPDVVIKALRGMKNLKRTGVTLSPAFMLRNAIRDTITSLTLDKNLVSNPFTDGWGKFAYDQAMLYPRAVKQIFVQYPKAVAEILGQGELFKKIEREGGKGAEFFRGKESVKGELYKATKAPGKKYIEVPIDWVKHPFKAMESFASTIEQMPRYVMAEREYLASLKKGLTEQEAVKNAALMFREGTADFSEKGAFTGFTKVHNEPTPGSWIVRATQEGSPFYTAGIAGLRTVGRRVWDNPVGTTAAMLQYITLPTVLLWLKNHDEDWFKNLSPEEKNQSWFITEHIRIPKPFELGMIGGSLIERMLDRIVDKDPDAIKGIKNAMQQVFPSTPEPPLWGAAKGLLSNKDPFWGSAIEPEFARLQGADSHERYKQSSSETGKLITGAMAPLTDKIGLSPARFDFLVNEFTGGVGKQVVRWADSGIRAAGGKKAVYPKSEWWYNASLNPFYKKAPNETTYSFAIQKFYENYKAANNVSSDLHKAEKAKDFDKRNRIRKDNKGLLSTTAIMGGKADQISALMKRYKDLSNPYKFTNMSPESKRNEQERIARRINHIAQSANDMFKARVK